MKNQQPNKTLLTRQMKIYTFLAGYGRFYLLLSILSLCTLIYLANPWHTPVLKGILPLYTWYDRLPHVLLFAFGTVITFREGIKQWCEDKEKASHAN